MINIYVITGFLGSGKTTFLNHFLKYRSGSSIVIENEFGKVNIDAALITEKIDDVVELTNGCMCCSLDNELIEVLARIMKKENKPDHVFIETTGIADTGNIIGMIKSPEIKKYFNFKASICIVDAENVEDRLSETPETAKQIAVSDVLVVNKLSSVAPHYFPHIESVLKQINPFGKILRSFDGSIDFGGLDMMLANHEFQMPSGAATTASHTAHKINTVYFETYDSFNFGELKYALHVNFMLYPHQLFRLKGFVNISPDRIRYLVQSTGKHMVFTPVANTGNAAKSELVFIGLQLKSETITRILRPAINGSGTAD